MYTYEKFGTIVRSLEGGYDDIESDVYSTVFIVSVLRLFFVGCLLLCCFRILKILALINEKYC